MTRGLCARWAAAVNSGQLWLDLPPTVHDDPFDPMSGWAPYWQLDFDPKAGFHSTPAAVRLRSGATLTPKGVKHSKAVVGEGMCEWCLVGPGAGIWFRSERHAGDDPANICNICEGCFHAFAKCPTWAEKALWKLRPDQEPRRTPVYRLDGTVRFLRGDATRWRAKDPLLKKAVRVWARPERTGEVLKRMAAA